MSENHTANPREVKKLTREEMKALGRGKELESEDFNEQDLFGDEDDDLFVRHGPEDSYFTHYPERWFCDYSKHSSFQQFIVTNDCMSVYIAGLGYNVAEPVDIAHGFGTISSPKVQHFLHYHLTQPTMQLVWMTVPVLRTYEDFADFT